MLFEDEDRDIMTVEDLMAYLNISRATAYKLVQSGKIKVLRIGHIYRISKESVKEFSAVILHHHAMRAFYKEKYTGGNNPPDWRTAYHQGRFRRPALWQIHLIFALSGTAFGGRREAGSNPHHKL